MTKRFEPSVFCQRILTAAQTLGIPVDTAAAQQLVRYLQSLSLWNTKFNLTAITDPEHMLIKHIFDSLSLLPYLPKPTADALRLLDVGTGAGLPGLIIAICQPEREVVLLDSNSKKVRFLRQVVGELSLKNVTPVHIRLDAERIDIGIGRFDVVTSRAFASLGDFVALTQDYLQRGGQLVAMKGHVPHDEVGVLKTDWSITTHELHVPKLDEARSLVVLKHRSP